MLSPRFRAGALVCALALAITGVAVSISRHDVPVRPELVASRAGPTIDYAAVYGAVEAEELRQASLDYLQFLQYLQSLHDRQIQQQAQVAHHRAIAAAHARAVEAAQAAPAVVVAAAVPSAPTDCTANHGSKWRMPLPMAHQCWDGLLAQYSWNVSVAFDKMYCESGGNPYAVGPATRSGTAQGLMQILPGGSFDPAANVAQAWQKYVAAGHSWAPWTC